MIKLGKYKTRNGRAVIVFIGDETNVYGVVFYPGGLEEDNWQKATGRWWIEDKKDHDCDLVSEWDESRDGPFPEIPGLELLRIAPVCPPGHSPARIAVAMNSEGRYVVSGYKDASDDELIESVMENADICELPDTRISFIEAFVPLPAKASVVEGRLCNE